mgnify:CR=1 FL=1
MAEKEWQWVRPLAAFVNEVDAKAIDFRAKVLKAVEPRLLCPPIEMMVPISHQALEIPQICAILPVGFLYLIRPTGTLALYPTVFLFSTFVQTPLVRDVKGIFLA